jgi:DNA primase
MPQYDIKQIEGLFSTKLRKRGKYYRTKCPFHDDSTASFDINPENGFFHCFGCKVSGSLSELPVKMGFSNFSLKSYEFSSKDIITENKENLFIPEMIIQEYVDFLWNNSALLDKVYKRVPNYDVIKQCRLGYSVEFSRFTIPIYDEQVCRNIKLYSFSAKDKMLNYPGGYGKIYRLYGIDALKLKKVIICAGEWDMLCLRAYKFPSITGTLGEDTWVSEWNDYFLDKDVYIIYDQDEIGRIGARKVAQNVKSTANSVYIVEFDVKGKKGFDVSDYFISEGKTKKDFINCLKLAKAYEPVNNMSDFCSSFL